MEQGKTHRWEANTRVSKCTFEQVQLCASEVQGGSEVVRQLPTQAPEQAPGEAQQHGTTAAAQAHLPSKVGGQPFQQGPAPRLLSVRSVAQHNAQRADLQRREELMGRAGSLGLS